MSLLLDPEDESTAVLRNISPHKSHRCVNLKQLHNLVRTVCYTRQVETPANWHTNESACNYPTATAAVWMVIFREVTHTPRNLASSTVQGTQVYWDVIETTRRDVQTVTWSYSNTDRGRAGHRQKYVRSVLFRDLGIECLNLIRWVPHFSGLTMWVRWQSEWHTAAAQLSTSSTLHFPELVTRHTRI